MMNRSTQKELIKLMLQLNEMWPQLDLSNMEQQNMVLDILNTVSTKCQKDFSKANADRYIDTLDSLGQVIKITDWQNMGQEELAQCVSLCQDIILQVINNLRNESELKKDIVFLPYKASMWDSLESVWKAANEDKEHCNTYVIPIPYCDRNPDGTAKEWHCEREFFPADVPTLNWQDVDLKQMHPDVIFFHYPYDNCNYVTSVDAAYYSRNLKQCTDKLVYIPYFVLSEPEEEIREVEDNLSHFILEPGVMNAHQSIVQSETMKRVYVNVLTRYTNAPREYWEKHILGLGSPKFDKVANSSRDDYELPEEWQRIIRGRKTVLYNTGLSTMLKHMDMYLDKVRSVLEIFKGQDDVVLWWRPHPLLRATFQSMNPDFLTEYDEIVSRYRQEGWGIYDDTAELERAVAWTDGYYGDGSSVVELYKTTEKPLLIQNIHLTTKNHRKNLIRNHATRRAIVSDQWLIEGDYAWFLSIDRGDLFHVDMRHNVISFLSKVPEDYPKWRGITHCCKYGDYIYCLPDEERCIWKYSIRTMEWKKIELDTPIGVRLSIYEYWVLKNEILFYSRGLMRFFRISLKDGAICKCDSILEGVTHGRDYIHAGVERVGDSIYVVSSTSIVYQYNIKDRNIKKYQIDFPDDMTIIRYDGRSFWLSGKNKMVYEWNEEDNIIKKYDLPNSFGLYNYDGLNRKLLNTEVNEYPHTTFVDARVVSGYVWFFPFQTSDIVYINTDTKELKVFFIEEEREAEENMYVRVLKYKYIVEYVRDNRYIGVLSLKNDWIIEIDTLNLTYEIKEYNTSNVPIASYGIREFNCEDILSLISAETNSRRKASHLNVTTGESVYQHVSI